MTRNTTSWTIESLCLQQFGRIDYPEYQREPNVWGRDAKQKLIDSILRRFDIGSLYFYIGDDGVHSCIDGRQRINAILSFLNMNPRDPDNCFPLSMSNEIETDDNQEFDELNGLTIVDIENHREIATRLPGAPGIVFVATE